jgi:hypothetical protein
VEGAETDVASAAGFAQAHVFAYHLHDVDGRFDLVPEVHFTLFALS